MRHELKQVPSNSIDFQRVLPHVCRKQTWLRLQNNQRHNSSTTAQHPHTAMNWWSMQDIRLLTSPWAGNVQSQILSMPIWPTFAAKDGSCNAMCKHVCFCIVKMNVYIYIYMCVCQTEVCKTAARTFLSSKEWNERNYKCPCGAAGSSRSG